MPGTPGRPNILPRFNLESPSPAHSPKKGDSERMTPREEPYLAQGFGVSPVREMPKTATNASRREAQSARQSGT